MSCRHVSDPYLLILCLAVCPPTWSAFNASCFRGYFSPDKILSYTEAQVKGNLLNKKLLYFCRSIVGRLRPAVSCRVSTASPRSTSSWSSARAGDGSGPRREFTSGGQSSRRSWSGLTEAPLTTLSGARKTRVRRDVLLSSQIFFSSRQGKLSILKMKLDSA